MVSMQLPSLIFEFSIFANLNQLLLENKSSPKSILQNTNLICTTFIQLIDINICLMLSKMMAVFNLVSNYKDHEKKLKQPCNFNFFYSIRVWLRMFDDSNGLWWVSLNYCIISDIILVNGKQLVFQAVIVCHNIICLAISNGVNNVYKDSTCFVYQNTFFRATANFFNL